jgi:hypothetical protein
LQLSELTNFFNRHVTQVNLNPEVEPNPEVQEPNPEVEEPNPEAAFETQVVLDPEVARSTDPYAVIIH